MRIKLFENYNTDEYYKPIYIMPFAKRLVISNKIFREIKSKLIIPFGFTFYDLKHIKNIHNNNRTCSLLTISQQDVNKPGIGITLLEDDWWVIQIGGSPSMYKCDGWDGIMRLLKDKRVI